MLITVIPFGKVTKNPPIILWHTKIMLEKVTPYLNHLSVWYSFVYSNAWDDSNILSLLFFQYKMKEGAREVPN